VRPIPAGPPRALIACVPNEKHEVGPRMLVNLLESDGWQVDFLGSGASTGEVVSSVREHRPRFVGLSVALARHLDGARDLVAGLREALGPDAPPIVVGGNAFEGDPERWREVGADLWVSQGQDPLEALKQFRS
jgi:MerR family transcriptional regulator, light-induced transcriptional regulator